MSSKNVNEILRYGRHRCMFTWIYFQAITYQKNSFKLRNTSAPLSYTRVREMILWSALESIGLNKKCNSLHRLRSGGATAGVNERVFKMHGRWKSDKAKDGYVKEKNCDTLSVLKKLGIWYVYFLSCTYLYLSKSERFASSPLDNALFYIVNDLCSFE